MMFRVPKSRNKFTFQILNSLSLFYKMEVLGIGVKNEMGGIIKTFDTKMFYK